MSVRCPACSGLAHVECYEDSISELTGIFVLKVRCWIVCIDCGLEKNMEDFKNEVFVP